MPITIAPGIYQSVPFADYKQWDAINASGLWKIHDTSPRHYKYEIENVCPPSGAMALGTALHALVLEPGAYDDEIVMADCQTRNAAAFRGLLVDPANADKTVITAPEHESARLMAEAMQGDPIISEILEMESDKEVSIAWIDRETEMLCKARLDMYLPGGEIIADIKTTRDIKPASFSSAVARFGYHAKAAFYIDGMMALDKMVSEFDFLVVENQPPFDCGVCYLDCDSEEIEIGRSVYRSALNTYRDCKEKDVWPGHYQNTVMPVMLPKWMKGKGELK